MDNFHYRRKRKPSLECRCRYDILRLLGVKIEQNTAGGACSAAICDDRMGQCSPSRACALLLREPGLDVHDADFARADSAAAVSDWTRMDHGFGIGLAGLAVVGTAVQLSGAADLSCRLRSDVATGLEWGELGWTRVFPGRSSTA
ncbi:hypothetical protein BVI2075_960038 [Burkholderia vietnamiensis]|nr:hypothetical protein BVI2075_960038 [Burkholderia vietnamiensis]